MRSETYTLNRQAVIDGVTKKIAAAEELGIPWRAESLPPMQVEDPIYGKGNPKYGWAFETLDAHPRSKNGWVDSD